MPISGLVLNLTTDSVPEELKAHNQLELGELVKNKLPAVLDTNSEAENKSTWKWLNNLNFINFVDVVFVSFEKDIS